MNNYSIDASVYAFPFANMTGDIKEAEEIKKYCNTINKICYLAMNRGKWEKRDKKYFFFYRDLELIYKYKEVFLFSLGAVNKMQQILIKNKISYINVSQVQKRFINLLNELRNINIISNDQKKSDFLEKWQKGVIFEKWFNIEDINFKQNKEPSLPDEVCKKLGSQDLINNAKKNIAKISYLNKYVYKNEMLHNIVLSNSISAQSIPIDAEFDVTMAKGHYLEKKNKISYKYIIKNAPFKNININNQNVNICALDALVDFKYDSNLHNVSYIQYNLDRWKKVLNSSQKNFMDHIVFGSEVKSALTQYLKKIFNERHLLLSDKKNNLKKIEEIDTWMKEGPNTLYENLKALNDFIASGNINKIKKNKNERYHCCKIKICEGKACHEFISTSNFHCARKCEFLEVCGSNIRYFGVDCSDEILSDKKNDFVKKERTKKNKEGIESKYWMHIKPKNILCYDSVWFMTLRVYFKNLGYDKIEVGWIGRHLYIPCRKDQKNECRRQECPLNQFNPKNQPYDHAKELENYLRQWPKQEPEPEN